MPTTGSAAIRKMAEPMLSYYDWYVFLSNAKVPIEQSLRIPKSANKQPMYQR